MAPRCLSRHGSGSAVARSRALKSPQLREPGRVRRWLPASTPLFARCRLAPRARDWGNERGTSPWGFLRPPLALAVRIRQYLRDVVRDDGLGGPQDQVSLLTGLRKALPGRPPHLCRREFVHDLNPGAAADRHTQAAIRGADLIVVVVGTDGSTAGERSDRVSTAMASTTNSPTRLASSATRGLRSSCSPPDRSTSPRPRTARRVCRTDVHRVGGAVSYKRIPHG
jgi:hypothetical protein